MSMSKYINDPREEEIRPESGITLEEANRKETMYHWGAMVLDLCDLPPEEYMKTIFHTESVDNPSGTPSGVTSNILSLSVDDSSVSITFPHPIASDLCIVISDSDGNKEVIELSAGQTSPFSAETQSIDYTKIESAYVGPTEEQATSSSYSDGTYNYIINQLPPTPPVENESLKYCYMKYTDVEAGLTEEKLVEAGIADGSVSGKESSFMYVIEPVIIPGFNDMEEDEYEEIMAQERLDLLVFTSAEVSEVLLNETDDQTASWETNYTTITIDGQEYNVSRYSDPEMVNICDTDYEDPTEITFSYKIIME